MKKVRTKVFFLVLWVAAVSCNREASENEGSFHVHGTLHSAAPGPVALTLLQDGEPVSTDTSTIGQNGKFEFEGTVPEPQIARLSISEDNSVLFVLDAEDITIDGNARDLLGTAHIEGSEESALLRSLMFSVAKDRDAQARLQRQFARAQMADETDSLLHYQEQFLILQSANAERIKNFIREHSGSFAATFAAAEMLDRETQAAFLDSALVVFNRTKPKSPYVRQLNEWAKDRISIAPGSVAPDMSLPQPDGTALALSSLRGKYVLIDFWASWCGPCREENPHVVALYNRYKDRGFEIYGVSLDESKAQWLNAIEKDRLPWPQVSDLRGGSSIAVQLYNVTTIPATFLLDKDGKILSVDLRGAALAAKLRELFDHDSH